MAESTVGDLPPGTRLNMYGDVERIHLRVEEWNERWEKSHTGFHSDQVREILKRHVDRLVQGLENIKILVPLCGKSLDIKWLADLGHTVVGIECSEKAVKAFFEEQELEYKAHDLSRTNGKLYQTTDGRIKLYCMDFFEFTRAEEGLFEAIWDKNALIAVNKAERERYCETILPLMTADCAYLLDVILYDSTQFLGPPHDVTREDIDRLFGECCSIEELEALEVVSERFRSLGMDWCKEILYLMKRKPSNLAT